MRHLILHEPERRNPITPQFVTELGDALADEVDAIVISAAPGSVFSAGGDLRLGTGGLSAMSAELYKTYERSEEHTSELQSLMRISYAVFCLKKKKQAQNKKIQKNNKQTKTANIN